MILRLYADPKTWSNGGKGFNVFAATDNYPKVACRVGGCSSAWSATASAGGILLLSNKEIPGWGPGRFGDDHFYCNLPRYGPIYSGALALNVMKNIGFELHSGCKLWWWAANMMHKMDDINSDKWKEHWQKYYNTGILEGIPREPEPFFDDNGNLIKVEESKPVA